MTDMPTTEPGRRERKKLATRDALRTEALRLFGERGYDRVTIQDITEAADVSPRTFFLHFATKEDLLLGGDEGRLQEFIDAVAARPASETAHQAIRAVIPGLLELDDERRAGAMQRARLVENAESLMVGEVSRYFNQEQALADLIGTRSGLNSQTDLYPRLLATGTVNAIRLALLVWYRRGGQGDLAALGLEAYDRLTVGLT